MKAALVLLITVVWLASWIGIGLGLASHMTTTTPAPDPAPALAAVDR